MENISKKNIIKYLIYVHNMNPNDTIYDGDNLFGICSVKE